MSKGLLRYWAIVTWYSKKMEKGCGSVEGIAETLGYKIEKSDSVEGFAETLGITKIYWQCRRVC